MAKDDKYLRKCSVCGKEYHYCSRGCSKYAHLPKYMDAYCSLDCKELYNITAGFINNWQTPEVEAARLSKINYKDKFKNLPRWMQDAIKQIEQVDTSNADAINAALSGESQPIEKSVVSAAVVDVNEAPVAEPITDTAVEVSEKMPEISEKALEISEPEVPEVPEPEVSGTSETSAKSPAEKPAEKSGEKSDYGKSNKSKNYNSYNNKYNKYSGKH